MASDDASNLCRKITGLNTQAAILRPRVFVLSDTRILRDGVVLALSQESSVEVVGSSDLSLPMGNIVEIAPDAVLLDIAAPRGLDLSRSIRHAVLGAKIVALAVAEVEEVVIECAKAGVSGFVAPADSIKEVVAAVHSAIRGEVVCSPRTAGILLSRVNAMSTPPHSVVSGDGLTPREREIIHLMTDGKSNKEIARSLNIRVATVKNHVHSILGKLRVQRRGEVAAQARKGLGEGLRNPGNSTVPQNSHSKIYLATAGTAGRTI